MVDGVWDKSQLRILEKMPFKKAKSSRTQVRKRVMSDCYVSVLVLLPYFGTLLSVFPHTVCCYVVCDRTAAKAQLCLLYCSS